MYIGQAQRLPGPTITPDIGCLTATKTEGTVTGKPFPGSVDFQFEHQLTDVNFKIWRNGAPENV
jgi:hypothetical protein